MIDYSKVISSRAADIKPSGIRKFFDILETMNGVVSLTVGQPDFPTPWHIRDAAIDSIQKGKTYYTSNAGTPELRKELSSYLSRRFSIDYNEKQIITTVGGSEAIDIIIRSLTGEGDEVIVHEPNFVCYEPLIQLCGGKAVIIDTVEEDGFKVTAQSLRNAITEKTKAIIMTYPNNPTGAVMDERDWLEIADVLRDTNIVLISDEIYSELTYGRNHISPASISDLYERTVTVGGFSKAYAMTGWRLGYIAAPEPIINAVFKIHQYAIMCAPTASQFAGIEALRNGDDDVRMMVAEYDRRRKILVSEFAKMGISCYEPKGAFYVFPNIKQFGLSSEEFAEKLLFEYNCAVVPGSAFGKCGEGYVRISYAYSLEHLYRGLECIKKMISSL
ncbi:MAG: aminotransferase class I/II-fold pyridoxal phosphate-dependent enzyme [Clostridia bacterium]|nr:aminotransferase class I/II-fold pyridoxal phosphate-dependent enzyme [Clostridia bacterium]